ncbi:MAG: hypothetical protein GY679_03175 [Mycoplasma sp.]|nr:hypothetical protein [Mycoplasma sp.]
MIKKQLNRRSERHLTGETLTKEQLETLKLVSNSSASSNNAQGASVIFITDKSLKDKFYEWNWYQKHIKNSSVFILFLIDFQRTRYAFEKSNMTFDFDDDSAFDELLKVGLVDATIKAQLLVDASLDMGLGTCYIGGVRSYQEKIIKELNLPEQVMPVLGLTIGKIERQEKVKPKMDTVFENNYSLKEMKQKVDEFDKIMLQYYKDRSSNKKDINWSLNVANVYSSFFEKGDYFKTQKELMKKKYKNNL